ncbi:thrombomodulin-like [Salarias fasciatus]|uniref:Thrombomodulin n=1 Tax=Salarias fasciatus TaxID=181472 RepID=A0A672J903_SALFA|nr:thrombomodulin-like [Salarias fasciatus]
MDCLQLGASVPLKVMTVTVLMSAWLSVCINTVFGMKQPGTCRPVCIEDDCITVSLDTVDFKTAEEACRSNNGELLSFQSERDQSVFDLLGHHDLMGNFWIGLRLPVGVCSNLSAPLRGYEWTAGNIDRSSFPSFGWRDSIKLCSAHCVSISNDRKWTERPCSAKTDGFLCKTRHRDACQAQAVSEPMFFPGPKGCSSVPCEHTCKDVKGGYTCSCFNGYIQDSKDPQRCVLHCAQQSCPAMCERNTGDSCYCPDGFVLSGKLCVDIDECHMGFCDQNCINSPGSYVCSCRKGYVLKDQVKCVKSEADEDLGVTTPVAAGVLKPPTANNNNTLTGSTGSTGSFFWIWIVVALAVLLCIFVIRFHVVNRQKRREQNLNQQPSVPMPVNNIEC